MQLSATSATSVQASTCRPHTGALNVPATCPPSENVTSALPVTLEPTVSIVIVPDAAKEVAGVVVQAAGGFRREPR